VTSPVLVARGEHTAPHHLDGTQLLVDELPTASMRVIAGAGHGGHQSHPNEFSALVLEAVALSEATPGERYAT
jgi:pimeloyl-ACP methyl ester carboxylesterase